MEEESRDYAGSVISHKMMKIVTSNQVKYRNSNNFSNLRT